MTPRFIVTEYQVQRTIFQTAVFDLYRTSNLGDIDFFTRFYSTYIQLLHLRILEKVQLLQSIILANIENKSHLTFWEEIIYLDDISNQTLSL